MATVGTPKQALGKVIGLAVLVFIAAARIFSRRSEADSRSAQVFHPAPTSESRRAPSRAIHVGETATIAGDKPWICGSSQAALDEATKWSVLHDRPEMLRILVRTKSTLLEPGRQVKVIDSRGFLVQTRKVRLLYSDRLSTLLGPGKECWVASEALR